MYQENTTTLKRYKLVLIIIEDNKKKTVRPDKLDHTLNEIKETISTNAYSTLSNS